jgi:hypothetical protein
MAEAVTDSKDPRKVHAGRVGAAVRWTPETRRIVRIEALSIPERAVVLALIRAAERRPPETA